MAERIWPRGIYPAPGGDGLRIRIFHAGKPIYSETIKCNPTAKSSIVAAKKRRDELAARRAMGLPLYDGDPHSAEKYFSTAAQEYLDSMTEIETSTHIEYENVLNRYWLPYLGRLLISQINKSHIKAALSHFDLSEKTKKNILTPLRGVFDFEEMPNPAAAMKFKRAQKTPVNRYRPEERDAIIQALTGESKAFYAVSFGCGLRPSEILALTAADYDGTHLLIDKVVVRRELRPRTKTGEFRKVYVPSWVRPLLASLPGYLAGSGHLFQNQHGEHHKSPKLFYEAWREVHSTTGIPYRRPYNCRHTRAAELLSTGVDPARAAAQLGHSLQMFLDIYSEFIDEFCGGDDSAFEGKPVSHIKEVKAAR